MGEAVGEPIPLGERRTVSFKLFTLTRGDRTEMIRKLFLSLCLIIGLSAVIAANAQIESDGTLEVNIPHSFIVRDTTLPAGRYMIKVADDYSNLNLLEIRSIKGHTSVFFETESVQLPREARHSELVFDQIGDNYFLSRIFLGGDESGNQLAKSRMQQRLEDGGAKAEAHSIAATRKESKRSSQSSKKGS